MTALPAWIDPEAWAGFVEMRKRQEKLSRGKIVWTARAEKLILGKLYELHAKGFDVDAVLNQSVEMGWQSVFAPKPQPVAVLSFAERATAAKAARIAELTGRPASRPADDNVIEMEVSRARLANR